MKEIKKVRINKKTNRKLNLKASYTDKKIISNLDKSRQKSSQRSPEKDETTIQFYQQDSKNKQYNPYTYIGSI